MKNLFAGLLALLVALGGGTAAAWLAVGREGAAAPGWSPAQPPRPAFFAAGHEGFPVPLGPNEGAAFTASRGDDGLPLSASCSYRVAGALSPARFWTLAAFPPGGAPDALQSLGTLREAEAAMSVVLSRHPSPGNWLPLRAEGRFTLTLTLFGAALGDRPVPAALALPRIETLGCDD